jgi:OFA family oxalate/formate antiporter-like MFS transporter
LLYTAKGTASVLVPVSSVLTAKTGGWYAVFVAASVLNAIAAALALLVLKPLRAEMRGNEAEAR